MNNYYKRVALMLDLLPFVTAEKCFALKGGTALNFFIRNMPRYSIDIDLTFTPLLDRETTLKQLTAATENIAIAIETRKPDLRVIRKYTKQTKRLVKLFVQSPNAQVKIEPNELIRGTIYSVEQKNIVPAAIKEFDSFVQVNILSLADLYGGKICAALDRQHPRDLFDIKLLLENEGLTEEIRKAFVVYLASHNRPINELLNPNLLDINKTYESDFAGMSRMKVSLNDLLIVRDELIADLNHSLTDNERKFLLSLKLGEPEWDLLEIPGLDKFPAIKWKLQNIHKIDAIKHKLLIEKLKQVLKL